MILTRFLTILLKSFADFFRDGGIMLAGSLSFFFVMAIVPFCLFLITILGHYLGMERDFYQFLVAKLTGFFPRVTQEITQEIKNIITHTGLGKFSLLLYGFLSYQLFSAMEFAMNTVFRVKARRSFPLSLMLSLVVVTLLITFLMISFGATSSVSFLKSFLQEVFPALKVKKLTRFMVAYVIPSMLSFAVMTVLYLLLPKKKIRIVHAVSGGVFAALFHELAKHLFSLYITYVFALGNIYGPLSALVIFLLWVFYSSCILLIGAEVVHNLGDQKGKKA